MSKYEPETFEHSTFYNGDLYAVLSKHTSDLGRVKAVRYAVMAYRLLENGKKDPLNLIHTDLSEVEAMEFLDNEGFEPIAK